MQCSGGPGLPLFQSEILSSRKQMHRFANPPLTCLPPLRRMNPDHQAGGSLLPPLLPRCHPRICRSIVWERRIAAIGVMPAMQDDPN